MDRELVLRAQRGEEAAFASLAMAVGDRLHATAHHILRDTDQAADAVQHALIDIWRKLPQLRDPDRFIPWAYRIVVREAYAEIGRRSRWRMGGDAREIQAPADHAPIGAIDDRDQLERGLARLRLEHRTIVVLKHFAGLSNDEISTVLGIPEGTVRSRLFNAMQALRAALEADDRPGVGRVDHG